MAQKRKSFDLTYKLNAVASASAATVSDLVRIIRIFNLEICNRTDFKNYLSSSDFARVRVYNAAL